MMAMMKKPKRSPSSSSSLFLTSFPSGLEASCRVFLWSLAVFCCFLVESTTAAAAAGSAVTLSSSLAPANSSQAFSPAQQQPLRQQQILVGGGISGSSNSSNSSSSVASSSSGNSSSYSGPINNNGSSLAAAPILVSQPAVQGIIIPELNNVATKISLYTRRNPATGHIIMHNYPASVEQANQYSPDGPTRIIVHGSFDGLDFGHWMRDMKQRFLDVEDANVIVVDWSGAASTSNSIARLQYSQLVGHQIAMILQNFIQNRGMKPEDIHVIAHGEGTFAANVIGRSIPGLGRITGLNPSGHNIETLPPDQRLDRSDAIFVDVIHTDEQNGTLSYYKRGTGLTLGDVDFYPNGGSSQPGCTLDDLEDLVKKAISEGLRTFLSCSHYRAIDYFLESITGPEEKCLHLAYECKTYDDFVRGVCGHCHDDSHLCSEMGFRANLYYYAASNSRQNDRQSPLASTSSGTVASEAVSVSPVKSLLASLSRGKRKVSVSGLDPVALDEIQSVESREGVTRAAKKRESVRLYYNTNRRKPYCLYHYNIQVNMASEPAQVRGGLLRMRIDGHNESIEVKLYGGTNSFKAGYTTGLIATHYGDIGAVKGVGVNWLPNSIVTLLYGENLFIEDIRIGQIGWGLNKLRTDDMSTLCPNKRTGLVTPFYGETYFAKSSNCTFNFRH